MARCNQPVKDTGRKSMKCPGCEKERARQIITRCTRGHVGCDRCVGPVGSSCKIPLNP